MKRCVIENVHRTDKASKNNVIKLFITRSEIRFKISRVQSCTKFKKAVVASHRSCRVHLSCNVCSCFALHDFHIYLIASRPPELHLWFPSDPWSSSLEVQVQEYNNEMLQSFHIDSIHGTQNASFASKLAPLQTFFTWPNSDLTLQVKDQ